MGGKLGCRKGLVPEPLLLSLGCLGGKNSSAGLGGTPWGALCRLPPLPWQNPVISKAYLTSHIKVTPHTSLHSLPKCTILSSLPCSTFPGVSLVSYPVSTLPEDQLVLTLSALPSASSSAET